MASPPPSGCCGRGSGVPQFSEYVAAWPTPESRWLCKKDELVDWFMLMVVAIDVEVTELAGGVTTTFRPSILLCGGSDSTGPLALGISMKDGAEVGATVVEAKDGGAIIVGREAGAGGLRVESPGAVNVSGWLPLLLFVIVVGTLMPSS